MNSLTFVENELEWTKSRFRLFRRRRELKVRAPIHEIYIDGLPLLSLIEPSEADDPERRVPLLWFDYPDKALDQLRQLLGGPLPADRNGRTWLLYCQCGDPGCGGLSTRISIAEKNVTWSHFGWDDIFGSPMEPVEIDRTFTFERAEYEKLLRTLIRQFSDHKL